MRIKLPKFRDRYKWHRWFAWYPITSGNYLYWLCYMERRYVTCRGGEDVEYNFGESND